MASSLKQKIIPRIKLEGFTSEEKEEILTMLENIAREKIYIGILDELSHEEKAELEKMDEKAYGDKLSSFLEPRLVQFKRIIDKCVDEVVGEFNALRN